MENEKTLVNDMTTGPVLKQMMLFALPVMLANILQAVYNMVDMIVVGQFVGAAGLSAVGICGQLQMMFLSIGMGYSFGGQVLISQQVGAKNDTLSETIGTLFSTEAILSVVFGALGFVFCRPLLNVMNTPAESMQAAVDYMRICCCGMPFIFGYNAVCSTLRGMGESKLPMVFITIASAVNVVLDLLFVAGFSMGAGGAALATVIAQGIAFFCALIYLYRHRAGFQFDFHAGSFRIRWDRLAALSRLGIPYIVQSLMITCSMMYVNSRVNTYGLTASAVDGIGNKLNSVVNIISGALSVSGATMMGQCFGAREFDRMKEAFRAVALICIVWWLALTALYLLLPQQIFRIFSSDPEVLDMAPLYLRIAVVWVLSMTSMCAPYAIVDGVGNAIFGLVVSLLDGVVARIGLSILLGGIIGLPGFWLGNALAGFVTTLLTGVYYYSGRWQKRKLLIQ